jgi:hypothetical protein
MTKGGTSDKEDNNGIKLQNLLSSKQGQPPY